MKYKDLLNTNDILNLLINKLNFAPKQMGKSIFFLCPFHGDKNPSLSFEPNRRIFTCFTCGFKASDIFSFWAQYKKIDLKEAAEEIGKMGYFPLSVLQEEKKLEQKLKSKVFYLLLLIRDIYQHNLLTISGQEVLKYLQSERQIDKAMISRFGLGCSISNRQLSNLLFFKKNDNFSSEDLLSTNLVWITDDNRVYDFFPAQQLIIPLANSAGKIVAFAARKIGKVPTDEPKYKYLPSYQHYHKSSLLYNYHLVKKLRAEECYLVEGFFDVISLSKLGVENCLALLGTNLSEEQIKFLIELKKRIVLFLDSDKAGQESTINAIVKLLLREIDCEVVKNNYGGDPDEICRQQNKEVVENILHERENPYLFILNRCLVKWEVQDNPQRVSSFIGEVAKIFRNFKIGIRSFLIEKISHLVKWNKEEIEPYFIRWNFPALTAFYWRTIHCREMIIVKEKKILDLCTQERSFWLLVSKKNYFFLNRSERENYYKIYNYYMFYPSSKSFRKVEVGSKESMTLPKSKSINSIFKEIDSIKKFMLKIYL